MQEPSPTGSRQAIAGFFLTAIAVGTIGFLLGRGSAPPKESAPLPTPAAVEKPAQPVAIPAPPPPVARAELLALAAAAADSASSGEPLPAAVAAAAGRRFLLNLPFGCGGPASEANAAPLSFTLDAEKGVLKLRAHPTAWTAADWWPTATPAGVEAIEGFWVPRPWSSAESCAAAGTAAPPGAEPLTLPGQTLAIAQFLGPGSPRHMARGDKPLEADIRVPQGFTPPAAGFRLRLSGRIDRIPGPVGAPIRCIQPAGAEQRPICVVAAAFEEAAIENPDTGETLASWAIGG